MCGSIEGTGAGRTRARVCAEVGAVAEVGAAGRSGDVSWSRANRAFKNGRSQAFDAEIDNVGVLFGNGDCEGWAGECGEDED